MIQLISATFREARRWVRGRIEEPNPPPTETELWLRDVQRKTIEERKRRHDWVENTLVYQDEGKEA